MPQFLQLGLLVGARAGAGDKPQMLGTVRRLGTALLPGAAPSRVNGGILGNAEKPGSELGGIVELLQRPKCRQESILQQILGVMRIARLEVQPSPDEPGRTAHQLLKRSAIAVLSAPNQVFF